MPSLNKTFRFRRARVFNMSVQPCRRNSTLPAFPFDDREFHACNTWTLLAQPGFQGHAQAIWIIALVCKVLVDAVVNCPFYSSFNLVMNDLIDRLVRLALWGTDRPSVSTIAYMMHAHAHVSGVGADVSSGRDRWPMSE
jgi:hypothetical protein